MGIENADQQHLPCQSVSKESVGFGSSFGYKLPFGIALDSTLNFIPEQQGAGPYWRVCLVLVSASAPNESEYCKSANGFVHCENVLNRYSSEPEEIRCFQKDLFAVIQKSVRTWQSRIVRVAAAARELVAQAAVDILQIVCVAKINGSAGVRQPCKQCLR
jgi:hypothetical protein